MTTMMHIPTWFYFASTAVAFSMGSSLAAYVTWKLCR